MAIDINDEHLCLMAGMDRVVLVGEEEGMTIVATDVTDAAVIESLREKFELIFQLPVRIDHIDEHPNRKAALEEFTRRAEESVQEGIDVLQKYSAS